MAYLKCDWISTSRLSWCSTLAAINCSLNKILRATTNLLFFSRAKRTLPNLPWPRRLPNSKSSIFHLFTSCGCGCGWDATFCTGFLTMVSVFVAGFVNLFIGLCCNGAGVLANGRDDPLSWKAWARYSWGTLPLRASLVVWSLACALNGLRRQDFLCAKHSGAGKPLPWIILPDYEITMKFELVEKLPAAAQRHRTQQIAMEQGQRKQRSV